MPKKQTRAEIIPYEPDAVNTDEGIVLKKDIRHKIFSQKLELPLQGVAVALNNRMIPRSQWAEQEIKEGDSLVIIKAACGG